MSQMKLTAQQWRDRAEAWLSCADHLQLDWTEEEGEYKQGQIVSDFCRKKYDECLDRAFNATAKSILSNK